MSETNTAVEVENKNETKLAPQVLKVPESSIVLAELKKNPTELSIINLVQAMILEAYEMRASDIHMDPSEEEFVIRFRIDGVLYDVYSFPKEIQSEVIARIKVLSGLRTDEHQMAQDGRLRLSTNNKDKPDEFIDVRVSIAPTFYDENCVLRLLGDKYSHFTLDKMGFSKSDLEKIERAKDKSYGMILAVGPTGAGKTTTLYAILKELNSREVSIVTVEDPVEYSIAGIDQIPVNERTGMTFAHGLRFILRQDPDVIMIGEIRDDETAGIAVNAALTGHKVLSTLHANDVATALPRLLDMKIEPFLITSTVNLLMSQRLVRTICEECKIPRTLTELEIKSLGFVLNESTIQKLLKNDKKEISVGKGCKACDFTGYHGRINIVEVMEMNNEIRELIMKRANSKEIKDAAIKNGMTTMHEDGIDKVLNGTTTLEEVLRVFQEE